MRRRQELRGIAGGVTVLDDYAHHPTAVRETLKALRKRFPKRRLIAVYEPRSATSRRRTFQAEFADAFSYADEVIVGRMFDPSKIPPEDRFDPEKLALDLHRSGTKASYTPEVGAIVKQLAESAAPGDVVVVLSSGSFDGLHDKLLDEIGDAMRPARRGDMPAIRALLASVGLDEPARDDQFPSFYVLRNEQRHRRRGRARGARRRRDAARARRQRRVRAAPATAGCSPTWRSARRAGAACVGSICSPRARATSSPRSSASASSIARRCRSSSPRARRSPQPRGAKLVAMRLDL